MITKPQNIIFYKIYINNSYYTLQNLTQKWQLVLFNDGSFTQNLNSMIGKKVKVNLIQQSPTRNKQIIRRIWIEDCKHNKIAFAKSFWQNNNIKTCKTLKNTPIGKSIINNEVDIHKIINNLRYGYNYFIEQTINIKKPIFSRRYTIYHKNKSLTTIEEFFSPKLETIFNSNT